MINILGYTYEIKRVPRNVLGPYGKMNLNTGVISIASDISEQQRVSTMLHEIIEVINLQLRLGLEESTICGLETGIYQTLTGAGIDLSILGEE